MKCVGKIIVPMLAIFIVGAIGFVPPSSASVDLSFRVSFSPPSILTYDLPASPGYGYVWTPGFWAWDPYFAEYYWVDGSWQKPPRIGYLWTPGYWAYDIGFYVWNPGYWGPEVGYYGGINYGWGYFGIGFTGGYWHGGKYFHNHRLRNYWGNRCSFNGPGGYALRPTKKQRAFKKRYRKYAHTKYQRNSERNAKRRYFDRADRGSASNESRYDRRSERLRHKNRSATERAPERIRHKDRSAAYRDYEARDNTRQDMRYTQNKKVSRRHFKPYKRVERGETHKAKDHRQRASQKRYRSTPRAVANNSASARGAYKATKAKKRYGNKNSRRHRR